MLVRMWVDSWYLPRSPGTGSTACISSCNPVPPVSPILKGVNPWIEVDGGVTPANAYKVSGEGGGTGARGGGGTGVG